MKQAEERTPAGEAATRLILKTFSFNGLLGEAGDALAAPWGLTSARWKVLGAIDESERPPHVAQIARNMGLSRQAVQRIVNELVDEELLTLADNPDHRRAQLVQFTNRGARVFSELTAEQVRWSNELAEDLNLKTIQSAVKVITTLCERLEQTKPKN